MYKSWIWAVLIGFDQLGNALTGGHPDVTVSARLGRAKVRDEGWLMESLAVFVDLAFAPVERHHCYKSYVAQDDEARYKLLRGTDLGIVLLTPIILATCPLIFVVNVARRIMEDA